MRDLLRITPLIAVFGLFLLCCSSEPKGKALKSSSLYTQTGEFMYKELYDFIDNSAGLAVELERELTSRPAIAPVTGGTGELDKAEFLEAWLKTQGFPNIERLDAPDPNAKGGVRPNILCTIPGKTTRKLWIISHIDVVPPGEASLWQSDPWTLVQDGNKIIGRGVEDDQQGVVSSCIATLALLKNEITPEYTLKLLFVADEENGSTYGLLYLLENYPELFSKDDLAIVPDGGDPNGTSIEIAEKNILWIKFGVHGTQAHGSRPDQGNNAMLAGAYLTTELYEGLYHKFNATDSLFTPPYSTFSPTKKDANVPNINTIPGEDVFYMDMRFLPRYPAAVVLEEVSALCAKVEKRFGVKVSTEIIEQSESPATPVDSPLVGALSEAIKEVYGATAQCIGIGGGTDAAPLRRKGIHAVVWARNEETAHQPNEYALISNIIGDAKVFARVLVTKP